MTSEEFITAQYIKMSSSSDDVGLILRGHWVIERVLMEKCKQIFPEFENVKGRKQDLSACNRLMKLLSAPQTLVAPCGLLNKFRNEFAHGKIDAISQQLLDDLANTMGPGTSKRMKENKFEFRDESGKIIPVAKDNEIQFRFIWIIGTLYLSIVNASIESAGKVDKSANALAWKWS